MGDRDAPRSLALVQTLVNTLDIEEGRDVLDEPNVLTDFAAERGLAELGLGAADVPEVKELREGVRAACLAHTGTDVGQERAASLERLLSRAPLQLVITPQGRARLSPAPGLTGVAGLSAQVAADIAAAEAEGDWQRLKACEAENCQWVFYDRSPAGRGRWCTMAVCGSRAKMRAYRDRRRAR